jgi:hypothetical protein
MTVCPLFRRRPRPAGQDPSPAHRPDRTPAPKPRQVTRWIMTRPDHLAGTTRRSWPGSSAARANTSPTRAPRPLHLTPPRPSPAGLLPRRPHRRDHHGPSRTDGAAPPHPVTLRRPPADVTARAAHSSSSTARRAADRRRPSVRRSPSAAATTPAALLPGARSGKSGSPGGRPQPLPLSTFRATNARTAGWLRTAG